METDRVGFEDQFCIFAHAMDRFKSHQPAMLGMQLSQLLLQGLLIEPLDVLNPVGMQLHVALGSIVSGDGRPRQSK